MRNKGNNGSKSQTVMFIIRIYGSRLSKYMAIKSIFKTAEIQREMDKYINV